MKIATKNVQIPYCLHLVYIRQHYILHTICSRETQQWLKIRYNSKQLAWAFLKMVVTASSRQCDDSKLKPKKGK